MKFHSSLQKILSGGKKGKVIMLELPTENYLTSSLSAIKQLTKAGYGGIFISFQRPFQNITSLLKENGVSLEKLSFIDVAAAMSGEDQDNNKRCTHISPEIDVDELVRAIYTVLPQIKSKKKFVFVDSLTTITLYKPLSDTIKFSDFLIREVREQEVENVMLIFNVAKDLVQKKFIRDVALNVDEVITMK